jgi:RHS repeat-associated protein
MYGMKAYTGREWDPEINLYYYRARYYDPRIGRFISADPEGLRDGVNLYSCVGNHPVGRIDPLGLAATTKDPSYYYLCCWRGRISVCQGELRFKDPCLRKCALEHEAMHLGDLRPGNEDYCRCREDKEPVELPKSQVHPSECRAWKFTLKCISKCAPSAEKSNVLLDGQWRQIPYYCGDSR